MRKTKDQKDLNEILVAAQSARDAAFSLFSRRLDTQRNVESFIGLSDAFSLLKSACEVLGKVIEQAVESKSSDQNSVSLEIALRGGTVTIATNHPGSTESTGTAKVFSFPAKKD